MLWCLARKKSFAISRNSSQSILPSIIISFSLVVYHLHGASLYRITHWCCLCYCFKWTSKRNHSILFDQWVIDILYRLLSLLERNYWIIFVNIPMKKINFDRNSMPYNDEWISDRKTNIIEKNYLFYLASLLWYRWIPWLSQWWCLARTIFYTWFLLYTRKTRLWKDDSGKWNLWIDLYGCRCRKTIENQRKLFLHRVVLT